MTMNALTLNFNLGYKYTKICCWNMLGFAGSVPYLRYLCKRFDIVAVSEHWLHGNRLHKFNDISSDCAFHAVASKFATAENYGTKRGQGGVALIWKKALGGISKIDKLIHDRICGIRLQTQNKRVFNIFSVYLPAQGSPECYSSCLDDLYDILDAGDPGSTAIVCGDMNGDLGKVGSQRGVGVPSRNGIVLAKFMEDYNLMSANISSMSTGSPLTFFGPTGSSVIDHILIPAELSKVLLHSQVLGEDPINVSDHRPVTADLNLGSLIPNVTTAKENKFLKWDKLSSVERFEKYTRVVDEEMLDLIRFLEREDVSTTDLEVAMDRIVQILTNACKVIPRTNYRPHLKPYWTEELSVLKVIKVEKYRQWVKAGRPREPDNPLRIQHLETKKRFNKELRRLDRCYENQQVKRVIESASADRNVFWKLPKRQRSPTGARVLAIRNQHDEVVYEIDKVPEVWRHHFESLSTPKEDRAFDHEHFVHVNDKVNELNGMSDGDQFLDEPFTIEEVVRAISKLHPKKACGDDGISTEHIAYGGVRLKHVLLLVYNLIVRLEHIPANLKVGVQIPLYKGKNLCSLSTDSYRGITLLNNFNKIYEILLWGRM